MTEIITKHFDLTYNKYSSTEVGRSVACNEFNLLAGLLFYNTGDLQASFLAIIRLIRKVLNFHIQFNLYGNSFL
jgi:hypothetical protein